MGPPRLVGMLLERGADAEVLNASVYTALYASTLRGDAASTLLLVKAGADLRVADANLGATALHMAAQVGHADAMEVPVQAGADVDQQTTEGATALFMAASRGETRAVGVLLRAKASPLIPWRRFHPIGSCGENGVHAGVVRELLQQVGVGECDRATGGRPALVYAAQQQNVEIMTLLTNAGTVDFAGDALRSAVLFGREISVRFLLRACPPRWVQRPTSTCTIQKG